MVLWLVCGLRKMRTRTAQAQLEGLEGYSRELGFDQNTLREFMGKWLISWSDPGFYCSLTCQNLGMGLQNFFPSLLRIREIHVVTPQTNVLAAKLKLLVSPFKPNYRVCPVSYLIENVRKCFVSTRCQKSPCGVTAYLELLTVLTWCTSSSVSSQVHIYYIKPWEYFSTAYLLDGPSYGK